MPLLALNEKKSVIDEEVVKKTIRLLDYEKSVRQYAAPIEAVTSIAKLEEKIKRLLRKEGSLSKRELERKCHKSRYGTALWVNLIKCLKQNKVIFEKDKVFHINSE